jgi:hypothetical protein
VWRHGPPPPPGIPHEFWSELAHRSNEAPRNGRYGAYDAVARAVVGTGSADPAKHGVRRLAYTKIDLTSPSENSRSDAGQFGEGD